MSTPEIDVPDEPGWTLLGGISEGRPVAELPDNLWSTRWQHTGRRIPMKDPLHGTQLYLEVCEIAGPDGPVTFAQREVSNTIFLFAVPRVL